MPMPSRPRITLVPELHHLIIELLEYDPRTGVFLWKKTRGGSAKAGTVAGANSGCGYRTVRVLRKIYKEHRLVWFYVHGQWPEMDIDHIDGNKHNNAIANLRLATSAQNVANSNVRKDSRSGLKGVQRARGCTSRWVARITENGVRREIGRYDSPEDAYAAYQIAASVHFGNYARI